MKLTRFDVIKYFGLFLFILTAIFSIGNHQADEHYQILEFAQYKLGHIQANELPWEFHEKMRASLQPWIVYISIKSLNFINITNPFTITMIFRVITALFTWFVITLLNKAICIKYFPDKIWTGIFCACSYFLWFIPYISVRFSSENYSAAFLLLGLYFLIKEKKTFWHFLHIGALFGLSVLFRYQISIAVFGVFLWFIFKSGIQLRKLIPVFFGFFIVIITGFFLDYLFYNEFVFTTYNYLKLNLIEGKASVFGVNPWWYYIYYFSLIGIPPISLILMAFFLLGIYKQKNDLFTWCIIPFLLIHFIIAHKEMRFFFPVSYIFILISIYGLQEYFKTRRIRKYQKRLFKASVGINFILLLYMMLQPANELVVYYKYLYDNIDQGKRTIITTKEDNYNLTSGLKSTFYTPLPCSSYFVKSEDELANLLTGKGIDTCFYVHRHFEYQGTLNGYDFKKVYSIYPDWIKEVPGINWQKILNTSCIYLVTRKKTGNTIF